jgi:hypothetical protein
MHAYESADDPGIGSMVVSLLGILTIESLQDVGFRGPER